MRLIVAASDPFEPGALRLIAESHALMASLFPPEDNAGLAPEGLLGPGIDFLTARYGGRVVGTGALACKDGYGEVKSLYVAQAFRGCAIGRALLAAVEEIAVARGVPLLRIETGDSLAAARALYRRAGFVETGPFGDYVANGTSVFMEKRLGRTTDASRSQARQ